jgi:hypothetical protein
MGGHGGYSGHGGGRRYGGRGYGGGYGGYGYGGYGYGGCIGLPIPVIGCY